MFQPKEGAKLDSFIKLTNGFRDFCNSYAFIEHITYITIRTNYSYKKTDINGYFDSTSWLSRANFNDTTVIGISQF
ncbi:hypothetical protein GCM10028818_20980 [Spirosoma horti]